MFIVSSTRMQMIQKKIHKTFLLSQYTFASDIRCSERINFLLINSLSAETWMDELWKLTYVQGRDDILPDMLTIRIYSFLCCNIATWDETLHGECKSMFTPILLYSVNCMFGMGDNWVLIKFTKCKSYQFELFDIPKLSKSFSNIDHFLQSEGNLIFST